MEFRKIRVQLTPRERAVLLAGNYTIGEVEEQLQACAKSAAVETITFSGGAIHLLAGDLNHAIVKRGQRGEDLLALSDRFDYINDTRDGSLNGWY
jgi:hypothetical protein